MNGEPPQDDRRKRQRLVESVSGTVEVIAWTLAQKVGREWFEELQACGSLGAVEAASVYDLDSKTPFEGFAWRRIAGAMIDRLRRERVRLPSSVAAGLEKAAAAIETALDYAAELRESGADDAEEESDGAATVLAVGALCLGAATRDPEALLLREETRLRVRRAVAHLAEREQAILSLHYFEGHSFQQIAAHVGVDPRTIHQRHRAAMKRLAAILRPMFSVP